MGLEQYQEAVGIIAGVATALQMFAPAVICKDIMKKRSTKGVDPMPFIGGLIMTTLFIQNGLLMGDKPMLYINLFAFSLSVLYVTVFHFYTKEKVKFYITLGKAIAFIVVLIGYAQREAEEVVQFRFGMILTILLFALIGMPLLSVKKILKTKDTSMLPIPIIASGTLVTASWLLYGIVIEDIFLQIQNVVAFILNILQLGIYAYCRISKPSPKKGAKQSKKTK